MNISSGISEKNRKLLDELNRAQKGLFSSDQASNALNLPLKKTSILLAYFARKGWLSRARRGLYITVPLGTINPQAFKGNPWVVASRIFEPCYIGGWTAAEYWEFSDQIFNSIVVFTLRRLRSKNIKIHDTDFILKFINKKYFGKTKPVWVDNEKIQLSDPIQTIVDILDDPAIGGGIRNVADIVREYFKSQYRNDTEIMNYIASKNNRTIYKRLGFLIETFGIEAPDLKDQCKGKISAGFGLLDPTIEPKGHFNGQWKLRINSNVNK
jgi:predicted transcriptional regulator of viral defense system